MDELSLKEFNRITALDPASLTPEERAFLYARRTYLTQAQRKDFEQVLVAEDTRVAVEQQQRDLENHPKQEKPQPKEQSTKQTQTRWQ